MNMPAKENGIPMATQKEILKFRKKLKLSDLKDIFLFGLINIQDNGCPIMVVAAAISLSGS